MDKDKYEEFLKGMSLLIVLFVLALFFVAHKKPVSDNKAESSRSQLLPRQKPATIQPAALAPKRQRKKIVSFAPNASRSVQEEKVEIMSEPIAQSAEDVGKAGRIASEKNQIMDELLNQPVIPSDYGDVMVALFRDRSQDVITRDFAVQHIGLYAQALSRRGVYDPDSADARNCRAALLEAADETRTIVAAAAFRALADVAQFDPHIDGRRLDDRLSTCAADASASVAARVMAVQLCGERRVASALRAIDRKVLQ